MILDLDFIPHPSKISKKLATNFTNDHELKILSLILKAELT